jgi:cell fate regulator YaaT (PSP1 superfamily)
MPLVVGVSFKKAGKVYYFDPAGMDLHEGEFVIAETSRGIEFGEVMLDPKEVPNEEIVPPLRKVVRRATDADMRREETNRDKEKRAFATCQQKIQQHNLPMKLIDAEYCFDGSQVTFFFSAESRVDFRELVKDLAGLLRTKVQLHQVGVRDEAKLFGGLGPCGRVLCCTSFMSDFEPVSMKMAKEQSLFLNPLKFSGLCGKLMCCLKYEYPNYKEAKTRLPSTGMIVETPRGPGRVVEVNIISESVVVELEGGVPARFPVAELNYERPCPGGARHSCDRCPAGEPPKPPEPSETEPPEPETDPSEPETGTKDED